MTTLTVVLVLVYSWGKALLEGSSQCRVRCWIGSRWRNARGHKVCGSDGKKVSHLFEEVVAMRLSESSLPVVAPGSRNIGPRLLDFGFSAERSEFVLVMEQCDGGSLKAWRRYFDSTQECAKEGRGCEWKGRRALLSGNISRSYTHYL